MSPSDRVATVRSVSKAVHDTSDNHRTDETGAVPVDSVIRDNGDVNKDNNEEYNDANTINVSDDILTVGSFVGSETQGGHAHSENQKTGNDDEDEDNVEDIGKFSIESISNISNIDHISIDHMNSIDNIDNIDSIGNIQIHGQNIISEQQDFPTIEVIKTVQRNRKKRQFSTIEDEEMSRLEFQQWTSGFLADDLEDSNVEVSIDDVEYGFPQTTAAHFTDVVEEQSNAGSGIGKKRKAEKKNQKKALKPEREQAIKIRHGNVGQKDTIEKTVASLYIKHTGEGDEGVGLNSKIGVANIPHNDSNDKEHEIHKIVNESKHSHHQLDHRLVEKEEDNVDPELANIDTNAFVHDAMLDARTLVSLNSLDYLRNRNEGKNGFDGEDTRDHEEVDDENLAVEAVNRAVNQAVAAVHAGGDEGGEDDKSDNNRPDGDVNDIDNDNNNEPDADVIAAAVVAAENSVRKRIQSVGLSSNVSDGDKQLFEIFQKEHDKSLGAGKEVNASRDPNAPLVTEHGIKNNKVLSKVGGRVSSSKKSTKKRSKEVKVEESEESVLEKEKIADAISKAQKLISDQAKGRSFSKEEADAIEVFIKEYEKIHNMTHEKFLQRIWGNERKKDKFWEILHSVLPNRTRSSLYKHVRRTYHIFEKRGVWTAEDDLKLAELAKTCEGKWRLIGEELKRMPEDCRDRWRNYVKCGSKRNVNQWTIQEEFKLKSIVTKVLEQERQKLREEGLKNASLGDADGKSADGKGPTRGGSTQESLLKQAREAQVSPTINWTTISELMGGTRSRIQCRYKWKKIMKNESVKKLREMGHDTKLWMLYSIKRLSVNDPNIEANLDWNALALSVPENYNFAANCAESGGDSKVAGGGDHPKEKEEHKAEHEHEHEPETPLAWNGVDLSTCFQRLKGTVDAKGKSFVETIDLLIDALSAASYVDRLAEEEDPAQAG
ncbi:hypothetical protein PMKS-000240 [Pichia membranifaciens]|uniref:DNA-binding protein n=1 Tax=Pichia membranifaciens TaxID=4926 RepID=A0A1Q2YB71_9ASCO|nr:hypothetical protein PMKS-000240 [Pichia membranifaciens]